ncbi:hypothetical protein FQZ97_973730 [compost metagenome]
MSRCVSLNQARANASWNSCGLAMKRREIFSYVGSMRMPMSAVVMVGTWRLLGSCASGAVAASGFLGFHWWAPAGLLVSTHSLPNRVSK